MIIFLAMTSLVWLCFALPIAVGGLLALLPAWYGLHEVTLGLSMLPLLVVGLLGVLVGTWAGPLCLCMSIFVDDAETALAAAGAAAVTTAPLIAAWIHDGALSGPDRGYLLLFMAVQGGIFLIALLGAAVSAISPRN